MELPLISYLIILIVLFVLLIIVRIKLDKITTYIATILFVGGFVAIFTIQPYNLYYEIVAITSVLFGGLWWMWKLSIIVIDDGSHSPGL